MDELIHERINGWMDACVDEWMDELINERINGWMN